MAEQISVDDAKHIRDFSASLLRFAAFVDELSARMGSDISRLGQSWQDPNFVAFRERSTKTQQKLKSFVELTKKTCPQLNEHADRLETLSRHST